MVYMSHEVLYEAACTCDGAVTQPRGGGVRATRPRRIRDEGRRTRQGSLVRFFIEGSAHLFTIGEARFHLGRPALMAPLGDAAAAALEAELQRAYRGRRLHATLHVAKLHTFFVARGEGLTDLPLDVETQDVTSWRELWQAMVEDAGIGAASDRLRLIQWLEARSTPFADDPSTGVGKAAALALAALESNGATINPAQARAMESALSGGEAGDATAQCTGALCVALLYTGMPFAEEDLVWWTSQKMALATSGSEGGTIDVRTRPSYVKLMKGSTHMNLERALKSYGSWLNYWTKTIEKFEVYNLPRAASMFNRVVAQSVKTARNSQKLQLQYLYGYFFEEFLGVGLPAKIALSSALEIHDPSTTMEAREADRRPTVMTDFDRTLESPRSTEGADHYRATDGGWAGASMCERFDRLEKALAHMTTAGPMAQALPPAPAAPAAPQHSFSP